MHILYIHQYFRTPDEGGSTRSYELAKGLVEHGHRVTMLTAHNDRKGIQKIDGISVHYLPVRYKNEFGFIRRIFAYLKFVFLAKNVASKIKNIDLAYVMTTPLTTGLIALHLKHKRNIPYYFEVGDLWPAAPVQMGIIRNPWVIQKLEQFEQKCYREAKQVIALSPAIKEYIENFAPSVQIEVITNLADCDYFKAKMQKLAADPTFSIGYFGTFGKANGLEHLLALAQSCQQKGLDIQFHLMGEGAEWDKIRTLSENISNISFHPFGNKKQVKAIMDQMDGVYISFAPFEILNTGSPNKFFDGLAMGKLIIINFGGWIKHLIEEHQCGFSHDPINPDEFIDKIIPFIDDKSLLSTYGNNSRMLAKNHFDKPVLIKKLIELIEVN